MKSNQFVQNTASSLEIDLNAGKLLWSNGGWHTEFLVDRGELKEIYGKVLREAIQLPPDFVEEFSVEKRASQPPTPLSPPSMSVFSNVSNLSVNSENNSIYSTRSSTSTLSRFRLFGRSSIQNQHQSVLIFISKLMICSQCQILLVYPTPTPPPPLHSHPRFSHSSFKNTFDPPMEVQLECENGNPVNWRFVARSF